VVEVAGRLRQGGSPGAQRADLVGSVCSIFGGARCPDPDIGYRISMVRQSKACSKWVVTSRSSDCGGLVAGFGRCLPDCGGRDWSCLVIALAVSNEHGQSALLEDDDLGSQVGDSGRLQETTSAA
jgi:hypothetical protein